ncbi:MAG TPA: hypothetical protein VHH34_09550 [Pseudonocardiaceae bacterium]|nr:hypothetical protein [Pseudonocardiaceae bacterium]
MTAEQHPDRGASPAATARGGKLAAAVISGIVLVSGNLAASVYTAMSWLMTPSGPGDTNLIEGAWFTAFTGMVLALLTALLTLVAVSARWLGKRWFIAPVLLFIIATVRWVSIGFLYPEWAAHLG